eukprot:gnl/TRDRNA2_/TRDRNA2_66073_c0_seq1.p1 gnl/TRDRNA2_/TRDRNA2_66073_c0~~gnl/TRDRNA2_/TRDRNA2_66073_c0_seq1.p1  ORF type:complete len:417 (+),score=55.35 gnl/TRDRNA2_/TRDRNA2_66073_c0_seq1:87-1337(+)
MTLLQRVIFPAPTPSYNPRSFPNELLWIPIDLDYGRELGAGSYVPATLMRYPNARYFVVYFHSNGEDMGLCRAFCSRLRSTLEVHVLVAEYPGYGLCPGVSTEESLMNAGRATFLFARDVLKWPAKDIMLMGRSLGSAVAVQLAVEFECQGLILVAPFMSLLKVFERFVGTLAHALVGDLFASCEWMARVRVPTLVIHGQRDKLVPCDHGRSLCDLCQQRKMFVSPEDMDHNTDLFSNAEFFVRPMLRFFQLPDYRFKEISVPSIAFDKRLCPFYSSTPEHAEAGLEFAYGLPVRRPPGDELPVEPPSAEELKLPRAGEFEVCGSVTLPAGSGGYCTPRSCLAVAPGDAEGAPTPCELTVASESPLFWDNSTFPFCDRSPSDEGSPSSSAWALMDLDRGIAQYLTEEGCRHRISAL